MKNTNRRTFLKNSALAAASVSLSARSWGQVAGANDAIRCAVVGFNQRGTSHINAIPKAENARLVALCDVDSAILNKGLSQAATRGDTVTGYTDIRKLLESKEVDVITIATPNHWHSLAAIWSIQAGKDVYLEKPVSHNVWEGRKVVEAAREHKKMVQTGTQSRASAGIREAVQWVKDGNLGKILVSRALCYKRRATIGKVEAPTPIPDNVDYDLWCGPAPKGPLLRQKLHYDWHWVWATGNGDIGNQAIHEMDVARWFLGVNELSPSVFAIGGRLGYIDDGETPNTLFAYHGYPNAPLIMEVRGLPTTKGTERMDNLKGASVGNIVECEGGYILIRDYNNAVAFDKEGKELKRFTGVGSEVPHFANFIKAVRSRDQSGLWADILEGHLSSALCHTGNISYRLGQKESADTIKEKIKGDKESLATYERMMEHLAVNEVDFGQTPMMLGPVLKMDAKTERFTNNAEANNHLTREYRQPFAVPERV